jgi:hypothetical protein
MLPVLENLVKQPTHGMKGFATLAKLWLELSDDLKDQRNVVVERALQLDNEGVLKAHHYWKEVQAYHEQAQRASTSSSAVQAPTQTLREPEEIEQIYRVFAKPVANNWTPPTAARKSGLLQQMYLLISAVNRMLCQDLPVIHTYIGKEMP